MPEILLSTFNARYAHSALGLRYLMANLGDLRDHAQIVEFDISQRPLDIVEALLDRAPRILGIGIYIWNVTLATQVVAELKRLAPGLIIILGGPEVSFEIEQQEICRLADHTITGEADLAFADLCRLILAGRPPAGKIIAAPPPDLQAVRLPYDLYTDDDIAHRVIYVEASRGCPFGCEFCLSSLDKPVRSFPLDDFLSQMEQLIERGARQFKFVDRTFNLNVKTACTILEFFLAHWRDGMFLHFEMVPDRLPDDLRAVIAGFPAGSLQVEVGIQTFNPAVAALIGRCQDDAAAEANLHWLRQHSGVYIHADLVAGLPGEDLASFAGGFDRLHGLDPQEIQVGILKRLRGAPIARHDNEWEMLYGREPPYEVLRTKLIDFAAMQKLRRFARYWDLCASSGNFVGTMRMMLDGRSAFAAFWEFSEYLHERLGRTHGIALARLAEAMFQYLTGLCRMDPASVAQVMWDDYQRGGRRERPEFLRPYVPCELPLRIPSPSGPKRQGRHRA